MADSGAGLALYFDMELQKLLKSIVATLLSFSLTLPASAANTPSRPTARPAARPASRPAAKPKKPGAKPAKPATKPAKKKERPKPRPVQRLSTDRLDSYGAYIMNEKLMIGKANVDKPLPIASVSKVFTTAFALAKLTPAFRWQINTYLTPGTGNGWQVHIASNRHPYFDQRNFKIIMDYIKSKGIHRIERLTFDEGVKFRWDTEDKLSVMGEKELNWPLPENVVESMKNYKDRDLRIDKIEYWPSRQVDPANGFKATARTTVRALKSRTLLETLKDMNRNSNNHSANQIFMTAGGPRAFAQWAAQTFHPKPGELIVYNGSGAPTMINEVKSYNVATPAKVVQVLTWVDKYMSRFGGAGKVLSIASPKNHNSLQITYSKNNILHERLMAKTGSVNTAITLAGYLSTKRGPMAFYFNIDTKDKSEWPSARLLILAYLQGMIDHVGPGPTFHE